MGREVGLRPAPQWRLIWCRWARGPDTMAPMTYESESISRAFYAALTPAGLAARTRTECDEIILLDLAELFPRASRILDVGCGYGRLAVPLAVAGHLVKGLDLSPTMVEAAQEIASGARRGVEDRVRWDLVDGSPNPHYVHDARSFADRCRAAGVTSFAVLSQDWGGRPRLLLRLTKDAGAGAE